MPKWITIISQNAKSIQVDFDNEENVGKFIEYLHKTWAFDKKMCKKVLEHYSGKIKRYSAEHATLMHELIREHFNTLSDAEKQGYISSKKTTYSYLGDSSALEFFATFFVSIITSTVIASKNANTTPWDKLIVIGVPIAIAIMVVFIKSALKPKFYNEIITTVENNINK